jgi:hypothetical protein
MEVEVAMTEYAVSTRAVYGPGGRRAAEEMARRLDAVYRTQAGYERAYYVSYDDATGEFGSFVVFDSKEHAELALGAGSQTREQTTAELAIVRHGIPERRIAEIFS